MSDMSERERDARIESLFRALNVDFGDDGFVCDVMVRVRRRLWVRHIALVTAVVIGTALSIAPVTETATLFNERLMAAVTGSSDMQWLVEYQLTAVAVLLAAVCPVALRWLAR